MKIIKELLIAILIICAFVLAFAIRTKLYNNKIPIYLSSETIEQVIDKNISGISAYKISVKAGEFIEVIYPFGKYTFHSGPAMQIFDLSGDFVDESKDAGDDPAFQKKWERVNKRVEIDLKSFEK